MSKVCWCDMCGYTATVPIGKVAEVEAQAECPTCCLFRQFSILSIGDEFPEHVAVDDPMPVYPFVDCGDEVEGST